MSFSPFPVNARRPNSLSVPAAAEPRVWTTQRDAEVKLRIGESGLAAETPLTINQMFVSAVERFGDYTALSWREGEQQKSLNYKEYYQSCRTAAKSFLKVIYSDYYLRTRKWFIKCLRNELGFVSLTSLSLKGFLFGFKTIDLDLGRSRQHTAWRSWNISQTERQLSTGLSCSQTELLLVCVELCTHRYVQSNAHELSRWSRDAHSDGPSLHTTSVSICWVWYYSSATAITT